MILYAYAYHIMYRAALLHQLQNKRPPDQELSCLYLHLNSFMNKHKSIAESDEHVLSSGQEKWRGRHTFPA